MKNILLIGIGGATGFATTTLNILNLGSKIFRWCVLAFIIAFIIHTLIYLLGFKSKKFFDSGYLVTIDLGDPEYDEPISFSVNKVNVGKYDELQFHLKRFLVPFGGISYTQRDKYYSPITLKWEKDENGKKQQFIYVGCSDKFKLTEISSSRANIEKNRVCDFLNDFDANLVDDEEYKISGRKFAELFNPRDINNRDNGLDQRYLLDNIIYESVIVFGEEVENKFVPKYCITFIKLTKSR